MASAEEKWRIGEGRIFLGWLLSATSTLAYIWFLANLGKPESF